jgi:hypothetical protein
MVVVLDAWVGPFAQQWFDGTDQRTVGRDKSVACNFPLEAIVGCSFGEWGALLRQCVSESTQQFRPIAMPCAAVHARECRRISGGQSLK